VVNTSGVKACRVFSKDQKREVLFLEKTNDPETDTDLWSVLFNSRDLKIGESFELPGGLKAELVKKGRPQTLKLSSKIDNEYFNKHGQMALPPYIQKARESRSTLDEDFYWYQLDWKKNQKSLAAPTASLHFKKKDLDRFVKESEIEVAEVSLDVGLGTFLPLEDKNFKENKLHKESFTVPKEAKEKIFKAKANKNRIWALGTTALRAIESMSSDVTEDSAQTDLFIYPGYEFKYVSGLLTNFHQPKSSLLLLVMAFFGVEQTQKAYAFAVENEFRLFSYGDLGVWTKKI